jgi:multicomponent Na+:H+ antiporter subunit E
MNHAPNRWNLFAWLALGALFLRELILSAWDVLRATLAPRLRARSAIIAVPLEIQSDAGITLMADMVTLTPGTTSLHVSEDRRTLYVHAMHAESPEAVAASIRNGFEAATRKVLS